MLPAVNIPVQPSSQDCLAWSSDGELAIAAGEDVYLLIPQQGSPEPWTHVRITVSNFTTKEWPRQEQASFKDMSIGEEQARATVTALAWSPTGLAKHGRSVLAILTSNLILSLWASDSDSTDLHSWKRTVIVNRALSSGSRLQQRIRSIAWAPTNPQHVDSRTPFSRNKWGIHLLAVADDSNGLYILKVSSPFAGQSFAWNVEMLCRDDIPVSYSSKDRPSLLKLAMNANHFIDRIEFGMWDNDIPVMYRTSGINHHARVSVDEDPPSRARAEIIPSHGSFTVSLDEPFPGDANWPAQVIVTPLIKARMAMEIDKYGLDNKIGRDVTLRTWGLASFNDLIAACITLHPAKMIESTAPFEGTATILFDAGNDNSNAGTVFPWQSRGEVDVAKAQGSILDTILDQNLHRPLALNDLDLKIIYTAFCGSLLLRDQKRNQRLQAVAGILNLIERHTGIELLAEHRALKSIQSSNQLSDPELIKIIRHMTEARGQAELSSHTPEKALLNLCPFCPELQQVIPFDSLTEANCPQKHPFTRCALTFLPLLEPGIAKCCMICKRDFFDEQSHPGIHMKLSQRLGPINIDDSNVESNGHAQEENGLVKHSLASVLFDKFDTCPYCGGRFFG